ncbi:MAG: 50S ribosomal protein L18e [DPANN group archaeon]|nr:50S ribosomal protein L18e [DPANN group archaeon]
MKRTGPTNEHLRRLIEDLRKLSRKENVRIWKRIADDLEKPTRQRRIINLSKVALHTKDNEQIIVPGKVLASGDLPHRITIAAYQFSQTALAKIRESESVGMSIQDAMTKNPKGKNLRIMG